MALVTIAGFPCSGKTTLARALRDDLETRLGEPSYKGPRLRVVVVDDESNHVPRSTYDDSRSEKSGRANVFAAVTRNIGADSIVICDSPNYIKGFRYQMFCAAREANLRVCTLHVRSDMKRDPHQSDISPKREFPSFPPQGKADHTSLTPRFDNLIMRFEEPSSMVRWDSPLFVIPTDEAPPFDAIWAALISGIKPPPPNAVVVPAPPPPNALQILSGTTSLIVSGVLTHMANFPGSGSYRIPSPPALVPAKGAEEEGLMLSLPTKTVTLAELQRLKRQFEGVQVKAHSNGAKAQSSWTEQEVASKFVSFLEATWGT